MRDEADEEKPGEQEDADGEYGVSSIEYSEMQAAGRAVITITAVRDRGRGVVGA